MHYSVKPTCYTPNLSHLRQCESTAVADPRFPIGGVVDPLGGMDLSRGCFSVKMHAKTKELGPEGGGMCQARPIDLAMNLVESRHP